MPYKHRDIEKILPENEVHWKITYCPKRRVERNEYRISIELEDKKRQYSCISFVQLCKLIERMPLEKRCLYEHISRGDFVKFYLDYEYYKDEQNNMIDVDRAISCIQQLFIDVIKMSSRDKNISRRDMVILESSSIEKESYHIILDHEDIRFSNAHSVHVFVEEVFRLLLLATINHECLRNRNNVIKKWNDQSTFMEIMESFSLVWIDWFTCVDCKIENTQLSVNDVCNLFVHNQQNIMVPSVDFKVYGIEQDFRMFMCTKRNEVRPLKRSMLFSKHSEVSAISSKDIQHLFTNLLKRDEHSISKFDRRHKC